MPAWSEFRGDRLLVVLEGDDDLAVLRQVITGAIEDLRFQAPMRILIDGSRSRLNPPVSEIREMVEYFLQIRDRFDPEWTVLVGDPLRYGLARMGASFADARGLNITVVMDPADAAWAGNIGG